MPWHGGEEATIERAGDSMGMLEKGMTSVGCKLQIGTVH